MRLSLFSLIILSSLAITSCEKFDDFKKKDKEDKKEMETCFSLVYPVSWTLPDATIISGNEEEIETAMKAWYETNPTSENKPELNYPVDIIWADGTTKTIADEDAMVIAKKHCSEKEKDE